MKKITCIQQYVIDNLIEDEILSTNSLLGAVSKVCSEEQFSSKYYCIYTVRISINFVGLIFRQCMIIVANVII